VSAVGRALADAARRLAPISDTAGLDAELLLAHAAGIGREQVLLSPPKEVPATFESLVMRRLAGEPIAYLTGRRSFWTIELEVGPGVLIPRPDSETLIAAACEHFTGTSGPARILDLGTGPGTLLLAALDQWPSASGIGVDRSELALEYARRNAQRVAPGRAELRVGNWGEGVDDRFDLILCNPPYISESAELGRGVAEHEPPEALFAGADGLDAYRELAPQFSRLLATGGAAIVEIGFDQGESAAAILTVTGLESRVVRDLAGHDRALVLTQV
jgi:release factor glutamine methyltransferase